MLVPTIPKRLSQNDKRWRDEIIPVGQGIGRITIGSDGCYIDGLCIGLAKFFPERKNKFVTPYEMTQYIDFDKYGQVVYTKANFEKFKKLGFRFEDRVWGYFPSVDNKKIKALCLSPDHFVLLQVLTHNGYKHWVYALGRSIRFGALGFAIIDTWDGDVVWKATGWKGRYVRVTGYAVYSRHQPLEKMRH